jgi:hypothetical protein
MSSDDEYRADNRRTSLVSPVPPSAVGGAFPPESPNLDDRDDQRGSTGASTANDIVSSDERVKQILFSDVYPPRLTI